MLIGNRKALEENGNIGDFSYSDDYKWFWFIIYDEVDLQKRLHIIPISDVPVDNRGIYWLWDGNKEEPTFIPSPQSSLVSVRILGDNGGPDRFHKSMVKGQWV